VSPRPSDELFPLRKGSEEILTALKGALLERLETHFTTVS
jgi:hypothetical protein